MSAKQLPIVRTRAFIIAVVGLVVLAVVALLAYRQISSADTILVGSSCPDAVVPTLPSNLPEVSALKGELKKTNARLAPSFLRGRGLSKTQLVNRKQVLLQLMETSPDDAIVSLTSESPNLRSTINATNCVERIAAYEGTVREVHGHVPKRGGGDLSVTYYVLKMGDGKELILHPSSGAAGLLTTGDVVAVRGWQLDNHLVFASDVDTAKNPKLKSIVNLKTQTSTVVKKQGPQPKSVGQQKTIVALTNFSNTSASAPTKAEVNTHLFGNVNSYYQTASYNQVSMAGDVTDFITIPVQFDRCSTVSLDEIRTAVVKTLDSRLDLGSYQHLMIIAPSAFEDDSGYKMDCGAWGNWPYPAETSKGTIDISTSWILGRWDTYYTSDYVLGHEFGHQLGVGHSNYYDCDSQQQDFSTCWDIEYGDGFTVMGAQYRRDVLFDFNAYMKDYLHWLRAGEVQEVIAPGQYTIGPIEANNQTLKALKIRRSPTPNDFLYIEYRQPLGNDRLLADSQSQSVFQGALLHVTGTWSDRWSNLFDPTPPSNVSQTTLMKGQAYVEPVTKTRISVVDVTPSGLTVQVGGTGPVTVTLKDLIAKSALYYSYDSHEKNGSYKDQSSYGNQSQGANQQPKGTFPSEVTGGKSGHALSFNGKAQYLTTQNSNSLDHNDALTVSFWVRPSDLEQRTIVAKAVDDMRRGGWQIQQRKGGTLELVIGGSDENGSLLQLESKGKLKSGSWTHVVVTYDNMTAKIYMNGELDAQSANASNKLRPNNNHPLTVGIRQDVQGGSRDKKEKLFNGTIDELGKWNEALDATSVRTLYSAAK